MRDNEQTGKQYETVLHAMRKKAMASLTFVLH